MSGFDLGWLDLREPADHAARDPLLLARAAARLCASSLVVDLGCGSGSTYRALEAPCAWRLVDNDRALLEAAAARTGGEPVLADLSKAETLDLSGATLVTASALLDLVSSDWIDALAAKLGGAALYAALTYDGVMTWDEAHPLDDAVTAAFNAHQQTDKGFGTALGPTAIGVAVRRLEAAGFKVSTAPSPWRLGPDHAALERDLVAGIAGAVLETDALGASDVTNWLDMRRTAAGRSGCFIGHQDLLALPL